MEGDELRRASALTDDAVVSLLVRASATPTPVQAREGITGGNYRGRSFSCQSQASHSISKQPPTPRREEDVKRGVPKQSGRRVALLLPAKREVTSRKPSVLCTRCALYNSRATFSADPAVWSSTSIGRNGPLKSRCTVLVVAIGTDFRLEAHGDKTLPH